MSSSAQLIMLGETVENQVPLFSHDVAIFDRGIQGYSFGNDNFLAEKICRNVVDFRPSSTDGSLKLDAAPSVRPKNVVRKEEIHFQMIARDKGSSLGFPKSRTTH
ncbi:hypothetical protein OUZ56_012459 [Daphnia magna]|uniref:Uncharacterized protein n=1 Tax=Daphnia magna TaxID=35525 RepID=A0ABQ9Z376_9CRUS|nr:hypothetical protein OUZ56_012459 [Daphnia magna]